MAAGANQTDVLTTGKVPRICRVASRTVMKWYDRKHLKGYRIPGSNDRRFLPDDVRRFLEANGMPVEWMDQFLAQHGGGRNAQDQQAGGGGHAGVSGGDGVGAGDRGADTGVAGDLRGGRERE